MGYNLATSNIDILISLYDPVSQNYLFPIFLFTLQTDIDGYVLAVIPYDILNSANIALTLVLNNQFNVGPDSFWFEISVERAVPEITYTIADYGITQSADIEITVINEQNVSINGTIKWYLKTSSNVVIIEGEKELSSLDGIYLTKINIPANFVGDYTLVIDYHDTNTLIKFHDSSYIIDIGWTRETSVVNSSSLRLIYMDNSNITFTLRSKNGNNPLSNIEAKVLVDGRILSGITDQYGVVSFDLTLLPGTYKLRLTIKDSVFVTDIEETYELTILKGNSGIQLTPPADIADIAPQVVLNITDPLQKDLSIDNYSVQIYRDDVLINDVVWKYEEGTITILPIYSQSSAISTKSNHESHLYPGKYRIELTRYHPYYVNSTVSQQFVISPMHVEFYYKVENINGTDYLLISYQNITEVEIEFSTRLRNTDLSDVAYFINIDRIMIPWDRGTFTILIEGTGYVGGEASGFHEIVSSSTNSTSSASNSTVNPDDSAFGSFISVNSVQTTGIIVITATAGFAPARRYLKRRK